MMEFYTIGIIAFLGALSPGPDFVVVAKNAMASGRSSGVLTALGIAVGLLFHCSYCILGLAIIITQSLILFSIIKYIGATYLIYLGIRATFSRSGKALLPQVDKQHLPAWRAFREGLLVNLLNPKCALFLMAIFTVVVKPHTAYGIQVIYGAEIIGTSILWFSLLSFLLTQYHVKRVLDKVQHVVSKVLGVFLVGFGISIALLHRS